MLVSLTADYLMPVIELVDVPAASEYTQRYDSSPRLCHISIVRVKYQMARDLQTVRTYIRLFLVNCSAAITDKALGYYVQALIGISVTLVLVPT